MTQYQLRTGTAPSGNPHSYGDVDKIRALLDATDAAAIAKAGAAHKAASEQLARLRDFISHASKTLADTWDDDAATATQAMLKKLHATADELSAATGKIGGTLDWYGAEILPWYVKHKPGAGWFKTGGDDDYAREYMTRLNGRITEAWSRLPESVTTQAIGKKIDRPGRPNDPTHPPERTAVDRRPGPTSGNATRDGSGGGTLSNAAGAPGRLSSPHEGGLGGLPSGQPGPDAIPSGTDLAGVGGGAGPGSPFSSVPGGFESGGAPSTLGGPGSPGLGGTPGSLPAPGGAPGGLGPLGGRPGSSSVPGSVGPRGSAGAGAGRGTGPMGPGGMGGTGPGGSRQEERRRDYWLSEDEESWVGDPTVAPVIGADSPTAVEYDEDSWRLDSATELWGAEAVPEPSIGWVPPAPQDEEDELSNTATGCACGHEKGHGKSADTRPGRLEAPPELRGDE